MFFRRCWWVSAWISASLLFALAAEAQVVTVDQHNRTIEITVQGSVDIQADLVSITVGYHNWGSTHDAAYQDNMRVADQVIKVWTAAGVSHDEISTEELTTNAVSENELKNIPPTERKQKQYEAMQAWSITAKPEAAQKLVDLAVASGANYVEDPSWQLSDPAAADAKAYAAALAQAHAVAQQLASSFGSKVGPLLYASNQSAVAARLMGIGGGMIQTESASIVPRTWPPLHPVKLLPPKLSRGATVRAIFALE